MHEVFYAGPYSINNKPMILKKWCPNFDFNAEFLTAIPLWVKLPKLPVSCWSSVSLSKIASTLGILLFADECTTNQTRISYARMLIKVDVTRPVPDFIPVMDPSGQVFQQQVGFEWKPEYCEKCLKLGHNCINKNTAPSQQQRVHKQQDHQPKKRKQPIQQWQAREEQHPVILGPNSTDHAIPQTQQDGEGKNENDSHKRKDLGQSGEANTPATMRTQGVVLADSDETDRAILENPLSCPSLEYGGLMEKPNDNAVVANLFPPDEGGGSSIQV
ncbi:uncharacterized protein LOC132637331 [Lycium barbarum]|uniref:uncharacterized protein LOC132637331 n=1 Tax=Lycium barbarum TaxID=112863 RepID=UPI00293EDA18|nr:uncharacterized protein LOC132637331 [Lycium barbarum]